MRSLCGFRCQGRTWYRALVFGFPLQYSPHHSTLSTRAPRPSSSSYGMTSAVIPTLWERSCQQHHFIDEETAPGGGMPWPRSCSLGWGGDGNAHPGCPPESVSTWLKRTWDLQWKKGDRNPGSWGAVTLAEAPGSPFITSSLRSKGDHRRGWW